MKLSELHNIATQAQAAEETQNQYVLMLGRKIEAGETTIDVFSEDTWTTVKLANFWKIQYDKYMALATYAGALVALDQKLQGELDEAMKTIEVPVAAPAAVTK